MRRCTSRSPAPTNTLRIPVNTVLFRTEGLQVAVLDAQHRVHLQTITQGRDFGTEIEVLSGVSPEDVLVANPPDSISDGAQVRVAPPQPPGGRPTRERTLLMRATPAAAAVLAALGGCSLAPHYARPTMPAPAPDAYKEAAGAWKVATPADAAPRGPWWSRFEDPDLNDLEDQVSSANQSLRAALARLERGPCRDTHRTRQLLPHGHGGRDREP